MKDKKEKEENRKEVYQKMKRHLYSKKPIIGEDSQFSELLQSMVNRMLDGEMDSFIEGEKAVKKTNKKNGKQPKLILSKAGI